MGVSYAISSLLVLTVISLTRTQTQYYDVLQGLQQLFQPPIPANGNVDVYNVNTRAPHKQTNRQESKRKTIENRQTNKAPNIQYDYVFATTEKPSRRTTKSYTSHNNNSRSFNNKNEYSNILFGEYNPYEITTKDNRVKTTTEAVYFNYNGNRGTTQNVYTNNNARPATGIFYENVNNRESFPLNNQPKPAHLISNGANFDYNNNFNANTNKRPHTNVNNNNRGTQNTDYNIQFSNVPANDRNNNGFLNTDYDPAFNNFNNRDTTQGNPNFNSNNNNFNQGNNFGGFHYPDNPIINRPGVQPSPVDVGLPPITNRPATNTNNNFGNFNRPATNTNNNFGNFNRPATNTNNNFGNFNRPSTNTNNNFGNFNRPSDPSTIIFDEQSSDQVPEILIGPDEDDMTERQKKRYTEKAERMCDYYKSLTVKKVVAVPLIPSPDPVEIKVSECVPITAPLVIGGKVTTIRDFPHMALVGWMKARDAGYSWKCGGSLISDRYVLTAGHCTYQDRDVNVISGPPQAVQLGSSYLDDAGALVVKVSSVIRHPKYKQKRSYHDIALLKLVSKVKFSEVVRPACLGVPPPTGRHIIATGWGRTEHGGDHSLQLRSVSLAVWDMQECKDIWGTSLKLPNGVTPDSHMCAGDRGGGHDTCQGDSGGPAQIQDGCLWRVVAVTSFGRSCGAPETPALYAVIPHAFVAAQVFEDRS